MEGIGFVIGWGNRKSYFQPVIDGVNYQYLEAVMGQGQATIGVEWRGQLQRWLGHGAPHCKAV
eukprot:2499736-Ditylum_brightwellii.AAC.1